MNLKSFQWLLVTAIIAITALVVSLILFSGPSVEKEEVKPLPTLVRVVKVEPHEERTVVEAFGTIQANRMVTVKPEVSGRVTEQSRNLVEGGLFLKGEMMLKIDPRDYQTAIDQEMAAVKRAEFELKLEQGKRIVAEREWELLDPTIQGSEVGRQLALREPQLLEKRASLDAAKSKLEKAKLDLERTILRAPFDSIVTKELTEVGQFVTPQTEVASLVATEEFRVQVSIPYEQLRWIEIPKIDGGEGSDVTITQQLGNGEDITREGEILRLLGDVDPTGRMTRLLVLLHDPLGIENPEYAQIPFLIGTYVRVDILGPILQGVYSIPREALREGKTVWIKNANNQLEIRPVNVVFRKGNTVLIEKGLEPGDEVVISQLPVAIKGMALKSFEE